MKLKSLLLMMVTAGSAMVTTCAVHAYEPNAVAVHSDSDTRLPETLTSVSTDEAQEGEIVPSSRENSFVPVIPELRQGVLRMYRQNCVLTQRRGTIYRRIL